MIKNIYMQKWQMYLIYINPKQKLSGCLEKVGLGTPEQGNNQDFIWMEL